MPGQLTERQDRAYEFIRGFVRERGKPPTLQEIGAALGIRSTSGVHKLVAALEQKGHLRREPNLARGINLVASDDPFAFDDGPPSLPLISQTSSREPEHLRRRPLGSLHVDPRLLGRADPDGCLVAVAGDDGMNSAGIRKNDLLVVEEAPWKDVRNDELVAALLGERLVVRRFEVANGRLHLRAAEKRYADESFAPDDDGCHVVGRVLAVMRKL